MYGIFTYSFTIKINHSWIGKYYTNPMDPSCHPVSQDSQVSPFRFFCPSHPEANSTRQFGRHEWLMNANAWCRQNAREKSDSGDLVEFYNILGDLHFYKDPGEVKPNLKSSPFWDDLDFLTNKHSFFGENPPASLVVYGDFQWGDFMQVAVLTLSASYKVGKIRRCQVFKKKPVAILEGYIPAPSKVCQMVPFQGGNSPSLRL